MSTRSRSDRRRGGPALGLALALAVIAPRARADEPTPPAGTAPAVDPMEPLRERFRTGMEQYRAGRFADAILVWEQIYRELGPEGGYRLSFNLGRAYDAAGDLTKAAEHYETYVAQVERRRARGEALETQVEKQERDARERLEQLARTRGRLRVLEGERPVAAQVDNGEPRLAGFIAYVAPGVHVVTFGTGDGVVRVTARVDEGQMVEVAPPPPAPRAPPLPRIEPRPPEPPPRREPFAATWIWVAGGATLVSAVLPIVGYSRALGTRSDYEASTDRPTQERLAADYEAQRSFAYAGLGVTAGLAALTAGLGAAWVWWPTSSPARGGATPVVVPTSHGASFSLGGVF